MISFLVAIVGILSLIPFGNSLINGYLRRLTVLKVFTLLREDDKKMEIVLDTIGEIIMKFLKFMLIYALFLFMLAIIPLKLLNSETVLLSCQLINTTNSFYPTNR